MDGLSAVYIISAGRPHCKTARMLERIGYPGDWYVCVREDEDDLPEYTENFGDHVLTYDYAESMNSTDMMDPFPHEVGGAAPARNAALELAASKGERRIWMMDDDIQAFTLPASEGVGRRTAKDGHELYEVLSSIAEFADRAGLDCVGGVVDMQAFPPDKHQVNWYVRAVYNLPTEGRRFRSRMEEDLCFACDTYRIPGRMCLGLRLLGFRCDGVCDDKGGCTTIYQKEGTIRRAAYNVLACPTAKVKEDQFGYSGFPQWKKLVPKLIPEGYQRR